MLKKKLELTEGEKLRHLEENSNERERWRSLELEFGEQNQILKE